MVKTKLYTTYYGVEEVFFIKFTKLWDELDLDYKEYEWIGEQELNWEISGTKENILKFFQKIQGKDYCEEDVLPSLI